jgi:hypothetical protein
LRIITTLRSDLAPSRDTSEVAIVAGITIAIGAFAAQLFAMPD